MPTVYVRRVNLKDSLSDAEVAAYWKWTVEAAETYSLHSAILRHIVLIEDHPQPCEYPPWLLPPQDPQDQKSVLHHRARWLMAGHCKCKSSTLTR
jgi:hypothetical protein